MPLKPDSFHKDPYEATGGVDETIYAFPSGVPHEGNTWASDMGMPLRDYFAAKAMNGELASMTGGEGQVDGLALDISDTDLDELATHWYRVADAMMKARTK